MPARRACVPAGDAHSAVTVVSDIKHINSFIGPQFVFLERRIGWHSGQVCKGVKPETVKVRRTFRSAGERAWIASGHLVSSLRQRVTKVMDRIGHEAVIMGGHVA
jgi:hypothetical protein